MTPVLAHAGHWVTSLIYALPVAVLIVIVLWDTLRRRRRGDGEGDGDPEGLSSPDP